MLYYLLFSMVFAPSEMSSIYFHLIIKLSFLVKFKEFVMLESVSLTRN